MFLISDFETNIYTLGWEKMEILIYKNSVSEKNVVSYKFLNHKDKRNKIQQKFLAKNKKCPV